MKHNFTILSLIVGFGLNSTNLIAQNIQWEKSYGGKHADYLMDVKPTPDYGFI